MERGLYAAASGMVAQQTIQDTLAQNLANASTVGYKQDNPTFRALQTMMLERQQDGMGRGTGIGELGMGVAPDEVTIDWQPGILAKSDDPLHASLDANQFFTVKTPAGERYTRAGNFQLDGAGNLITSTGLPVLDINGNPIRVPAGPAPVLDASGNVTVGGQPVARLKVVQANPGDLVKQGESLFAPTKGAPLPLAARPVLRPNTLEQSNVNPMLSLVELITISRGFEMAQRAIITQDEMLRHATNDVGKV
ncbi:MAG TPA: flagellar hook-basal body protein [Chthonomonadaceae bacterium]|nr:flagellar hook-basal body protein [Chthonomonadaceae bacterium]